MSCPSTTPLELAAKRRAKGLTQAELAAKLSVHVRSVIRWEKGETRIPNHVTTLLDAMANAHPAAIKALCQANHPELYGPRTKYGTYGRVATHPRYLLLPAQLTAFEDSEGKLLVSVLETDFYKAALEQYHTSEARRGAEPSLSERAERYARAFEAEQDK